MKQQCEKLPPRLEDYLETIYILEKEVGVARVKDIASERSVRMPTVSDVLKKLSERGFIDYEPYGTVKITLKGREYAQRLLQKHRVLEEFMREILKLPGEIAEVEGCLLEHHLGDETVERIGRLIEFIKGKGLMDELEKRY